MLRASFCAAMLAAASLAHAGLLPRDLNSDGKPDAYFDTSQNISWLANLSAIAGTGFDSDDYNGCLPFDSPEFLYCLAASKKDGLVRASDGYLWARDLNVHGVTGWRLPRTFRSWPGESIDASCDYTDTQCGLPTGPQNSELAHLFLTTLAYKPGSTTIDFGPFTAPPAGGDRFFYSVLRVPPHITNGTYPGRVFLLPGAVDTYSELPQIGRLYGVAWAVHDGDVLNLAPAIPEPATWGLMLLGVAAVGGIARRKTMRQTGHISPR